MTKEQKFYNTLKDIFVGAKVEGESGYINLMRIKSRYYEKGVFPKLQRDIGEALKPFPEFREELFDKLYTFFNRYFSESGSIYFRYTPIHQNVYEKVYTDDKDVILFWKTHMLYYVKTDRLFKNLEVEINDFKFFFDVSTLEYKKANEKRAIVYEFKEKRKDGTIVINVSYSERGKKTKIAEILKVLNREGVKITEDILEDAFRVFEKQSEVDYFINKNAKEFLNEQFNIWLYQYVFKGESKWTEKRIKQLQTLRDIAFKIIDFISQFEDELVKIWNKPKFVLNSNYVITLDRIADKDIRFVEKILSHKNFEEQVNEWKDLGIADGGITSSVILSGSEGSKILNPKYNYLPIDTKLFKDLELEILGLFEDLDNALDGWLIKSENYQALNTILPKFKEKVQTIYIDPPYNTGSDEFIYRDKFQHSSWLTMMDNRLSLGRKLMKNDAVIFINIGDEEISRLLCLSALIFGENWISNLVWRKRGGGGSDSKFISVEHDYILTYSKNRGLANLNRLPSKESNYHYKDEKGNHTLKPLHNPGLRDSLGLHYDITCPDGTIFKGSEHQWVYSRKSFEKMKSEKRIEFRKSKSGWKIYYKLYKDESKGFIPFSILYNIATNADATKELKNLNFECKELHPKPSKLINYLLKLSGKNNFDLILDFFAGSGTTAHAVRKLNKEDRGKRKFILVEMADYFETIIIPRIKKVAYSFNWKDGKPQDSDGIGIFFKYYELEQYEDTLRKAKYEDSDLFENPYEDPYNQYVFMRDLKMLEALKIDYENNKVKVDLSKLYKNIDIPETLSNLLGRWVKRITTEEVEFENGEKINIKDLDYKLIKPLIWW